jgi:hypothetical protein
MSSYGLWEVNVTLKRIPRLNFAGRDYMLEDQACKVQGVNVLTQVKDDLDCLFLAVSCKGQRILQLSATAMKRKWSGLVALAQMERRCRDDDDEEE